MTNFAIYTVPLSRGALAISPMPGRNGQFSEDFNILRKWSPNLVLTMTTMSELADKNATNLSIHLSKLGIDWLHLPIQDFGTPRGKTSKLWPEAANLTHEILDRGGKVLAHCMSGQGRSGMAILRLMVERGIPPKIALKKIRKIRPMAVETDAQYHWASQI